MAQKNSFKMTDRMSQEEFVKKFLPADHNEQDKVYLKERYNWETTKNYPVQKVSKAYIGTTFQKRN